MMKILEDALSYGNIHIAARKGFLYFASFSKIGVRDPVVVKSDRGFPHLYMLLAAAISDKQEIKIEADMIYQYPINHITSLNCLYERTFRHALVKIYLHEEEITAQAQFVDHSIDGIPGLTYQLGTGPTIEIALKNVLEAEKKSLFTFLSP